ncbi:MAG: hypothetical protein ACK5Q5_22475 [Planctomycetaceae bacterium]
MSYGLSLLPPVKWGSTSNILRVWLGDSTVTTGVGKTGLSNTTSGLAIVVSTDRSSGADRICRQANSTIETVTTLGTYAAPTAGKCRFREVDATWLPGWYELQLEDSLFAVASATRLQIAIYGATGTRQGAFALQLPRVDPNNAVNGGMSALPNATAEAAGGLPTLGTGSGQLQLSGGKVTAASVDGDVGGKVLGNGGGTITGPGAWILDAAGNAVAPAGTALSNAQ